MKKTTAIMIICTILVGCPSPDESPATISITNSNVSVISGTTYQFNADKPAAWSVSSTVPEDAGFIDADGLYTAAALPTLSDDKVTVTVTAALKEDTSRTDTLDFTVEKRYYKVADIGVGNAYLVCLNDKIYCNGTGANGEELYCFDGTSFYEVANVDDNAGTSSSPEYLTVFNGNIYFRATVSGDSELYCYNGINASIVEDIWVGDSSYPSNFCVYNSRLYFKARKDNSSDYELWYYDGTNPCVEIDIRTGTSGSGPTYMYVWNGKMYFQASVSNGKELWYHDGTTQAEIYDLDPDVDDSSPSSFCGFGSYLYFTAKDEFSNYEVWRYDGSTTPFEEFEVYSSVDPGYPKSYVPYNGNLYLSGRSTATDYELHYHDGTTNPIQKAFDVNPSGDGEVYVLGVYKDKLYFLGNNGSSGQELFSWDETELVLYDIIPGGSDSIPGNLIECNGKLYFTIYATNKDLYVFNDY
ncbi:MAG: hypothetical protein JW881_07725 [Spirochaetales bacterium]|nr:hypothetical protein [Spirochaetales bacterium]